MTEARVITRPSPSSAKVSPKSLLEGYNHKVRRTGGFYAHGAPCVRSRAGRPPQLTDAENKRFVAHDAASWFWAKSGKPESLLSKLQKRLSGTGCVTCYTAVTNSNEDWGYSTAQSGLLQRELSGTLPALNP